MDWKLAAYVGLGSAIGGVARFALSGWVIRSHVPAGTFAVNVLGCFLIGMLVFGGMAGGWLGPSARAFFAVGILGGFTTMSTFTFESVTLWTAGNVRDASLYAFATFGACLMGTVAGRWVGLTVWSA